MPDSAPSSLKRLRWHQQLSLKLGLGVLTVLALALLTTGLWLSRQDEHRFQAENTRHASQITAMVARALSERMLAGGGASVWNDVSALSLELQQATGAARIQVMSRDGLVKASTDPALAGHRYALSAPECARCHDRSANRNFPHAFATRDPANRNLLRVLVPIPKQAACARCHTREESFRGMIAIDFDHTPVEQAASERNRLMLGLGLLAGAGIFLLIVLLLRQLVHRPVSALVETAQALGGGQLDARASVSHEDELGQLARGFNQMAERIEAQVDQLELSNMELNLLYTLMLEVSRSMDVTQVQTTVLGILHERLHLMHVAFCVDSGDDTWCCSTIDADGHESQVCGNGDLALSATRQATGTPPLLQGIPLTLVRRALDTRQASHTCDNGLWHFAIPFSYTEQLVGLLAGTVPATAAVFDDKLLSNLAVHVGLALENARNFTQAITDGLTGFRNKRYGLSRLEEIVYKARRYSQPVSLTMLDIDHFKRINDTLGHPAGDRVLKEVSRRLRNMARKSDILVRYGGEEFLLILPHTEAASLETIGEKFRDCIAGKPIVHDNEGNTVAVTISVGLTELRAEDDIEGLIERADRALYQAKTGGRNRAVVG